MPDTMSAEEIVRGMRELLPPQVDYAKLVCAEGFAHGQCYVWEDPEPYIISEAADLIESLQAQLEEWKSKHRQAALNYQQKCQDIVDLEAQLAASQQETRAAVEDIGQACATCAHSKKASCPWEGTYHHRGEHGEKIGVCNAWQWRGHQAAKEETKQ